MHVTMRSMQRIHQQTDLMITDRLKVMGC